MPFTIPQARRVGAMTLMATGALLCVAANLTFATTGTHSDCSLHRS
jgi:hypothetical protein